MNPVNTGVGRAGTGLVTAVGVFPGYAEARRAVDALRRAGIAVRRCDTFPGLDGSWIRVAVRPPEVSDRLLEALAR